MESTPRRAAIMAEQVRTRLVWLSAHAASIRTLGVTRTLTAHERSVLSQIESESAALRRALAQLTSRMPVAV